MARFDRFRAVFDRELRIRRLERLLAAKNVELREFELAHLAMYRRNADLTEQLAAFAVVADVTR